MSCCGWAEETDRSSTWWTDGCVTGCCSGTVAYFHCKTTCGVCSYILWVASSFAFFSFPDLESDVGCRVDPWPHSEGRASQLHRSWAGHPAGPRRRGCGHHPESRAGVTGRAEVIQQTEVEKITSIRVSERHYNEITVVKLMWLNVFASLFSYFTYSMNRNCEVVSIKDRKSVYNAQSMLWKSISSDVKYTQHLVNGQKPQRKHQYGLLNLINKLRSTDKGLNTWVLLIQLCGWIMNQHSWLENTWIDIDWSNN